MGVFSFCLYGTEPNYYTGLLENIALIKEYYPTFSIIVFKGVCDPSWVIPDGVIVDNTNREGHINALLRYIPMSTEEVGFVRDADSRVDARDRWCIDEFLKSDKMYHSIRDHYHHRSKLMAGTFGWKRSLPLMIPTHEVSYGYDEHFLATQVYDLIKQDLLVHTTNRAYVGEHARWIERPFESDTDFVGNVIWNGSPKFSQMREYREIIFDLRANDQFAIARRFVLDINLSEIPYDHRCDTYLILAQCAYYLNDFEFAKRVYAAYEYADIRPLCIEQSNSLIEYMKRGHIIATFDPEREPKGDELVIVYGNYPDWHRALPISNKLYRHVSLFNKIRHDVVESHPCWDSIDVIYILNLEERVDRYYETLHSLSMVRAPLHKIHHYKAQRDTSMPAYAGATKNHLDAMIHFNEHPELKQCLILEDDIVFTDDVSRVWSSVQEFFRRAYDYTLCFLAISRLGYREPCDDLLSRSRQPCTTSSAYFLRKPTSAHVLSVVQNGFDIISKSQDTNYTGVIDQYWCSHLPMIHFFKEKLAFQRPSYSNLVRTVVAHLD
jgi:hypothetical protein